ncbi:MAG: putative transposase [Verrucomicrobiota bacterium]|nr:putative transposase [Verrucomicrobiota bacterium]
MCGLSFISSDVSRATALLDDELEKWRTCPPGKVEYLILDARYEKVRMNGSVVSCAVLIATGVPVNDRRSVPGASVSMSNWCEFMLSLKKRGMHGVKLVTGDEHAGLQSALQSALPGIPVQRCQVPPPAQCSVIYPEGRHAGRCCCGHPHHLQRPQPGGGGTPCWTRPLKNTGTKHRRRLRTTNMAERRNREIRRGHGCRTLPQRGVTAEAGQRRFDGGKRRMGICR